MTIEHHSRLLPRSTPESQGIASSSILAFVDEVEANIKELHSFMLLRHGQVVAEGWWSPYSSDRPHMLFSLSKSFTSTAAGMAIAEGHFSLDDSVLSFFPEDAPPNVGEHLAGMRVRHLLSMSTGHAEDTLGSLVRGDVENWAEAFLACPVEYEPGTHFLYNSGATYMVSAIVQKTTGSTVLDLLRPRLFEPLGISGPTWESCPRGINTGGWGLSVRTEDIARFGQLYLQKGVWQGRRLLSEDWVEQATARQISNGDDPENDWNQGYGYQFWRCRHRAYRGDGAFGQYCVVMPDQDAVLAVTAGTGDMQAPLNLVWKHLLAACQPGSLPEDASSQRRLRDRLAGLRLRTPPGSASSPLVPSLSGRRLEFAANEQKIKSVSIDFGAAETIITIGNAEGKHSVTCGMNGAWSTGDTSFEGGIPRPTAASGAWASEDTFVVKLSYVETPFCPLVTFHFEGENVRLDYQANVAFGPTTRPPLEGRLAS